MGQVTFCCGLVVVYGSKNESTFKWKLAHNCEFCIHIFFIELFLSVFPSPNFHKFPWGAFTCILVGCVALRPYRFCYQKCPASNGRWFGILLRFETLTVEPKGETKMGGISMGKITRDCFQDSGCLKNLLSEKLCVLKNYDIFSFKKQSGLGLFFLIGRFLLPINGMASRQWRSALTMASVAGAEVCQSSPVFWLQSLIWVLSTSSSPRGTGPKISIINIINIQIFRKKKKKRFHCLSLLFNSLVQTGFSSHGLVGKLRGIANGFGES